MTATAVIQVSVLSPACLASIQKNVLATAHESAPNNQKRESATEHPPPPPGPSHTLPGRLWHRGTCEATIGMGFA
jgi:hypothetical protein